MSEITLPFVVSCHCRRWLYAGTFFFCKLRNAMVWLYLFQAAVSIESSTQLRKTLACLPLLASAAASPVSSTELCNLQVPAFGGSKALLCCTHMLHVVQSLIISYACYFACFTHQAPRYSLAVLVTGEDSVGLTAVAFIARFRLDSDSTC